MRDVVTPSDIDDWMWFLNYVRRWTNWTVNVYGGYVILVIAVFVVLITYTSRVEYHINGPYIVSSGESKETTILYADHSEHTHHVAWDTRPYTRPFGSSNASDGTPFPLTLRDKAPFTGSDNNVLSSCEVFLRLHNNNCGILDYGYGERNDDMYHGYHEDINEEGITLVGGERMSNLSCDDSYGIPKYGYETTGGILEDTGFSGSLAILNGNDIEHAWGDDMVNGNVMGSDIGQGTGNYPAGPTKEWITLNNYVNMSMGSNIVYRWASNTIYVMTGDGQFESLTGSTSAIMSKETRDQKTLSVADPLNRDRDTTNNSVNRETIGSEQMAIRSGEPFHGSYRNNGCTRKSNGGTDGNKTNQRLRSSIARKEKSHSTDGRGVTESSGFRKIRILECGLGSK